MQPHPFGTLRVATAGSVDDGKSTLIGRLLHDSKSILEDQYRAVVRTSERMGLATPNLALLTDGLRAERDLGITIDVAHRYFGTPRRNFILADTPGHAEYTRNMVTGASTSDVAVVLVDARHGVVDQTRRHALIASLLGVQHIVLAVNKMDLVAWDETVFRSIVAGIDTVVHAFEHPVAVTAIPMSALLGDNVVLPSTNLPWHEGPPLLTFLEELVVSDESTVGARLHVQDVVVESRTQQHLVLGTVSGGTLNIGDPVRIVPGDDRATVTSLRRWGDPVVSAGPGNAVSLTLSPTRTIGRGDVVVASGGPVMPLVGTEVDADICWMVERPLTPGDACWFKHGTRTGKATLVSIKHVQDPVTLRRDAAVQLSLNDLGRVRLRLETAVVADPYRMLHATGRMILVDPQDNTTAAAVMIRDVQP